jgi:hypothetical protein
VEGLFITLYMPESPTTRTSMAWVADRERKFDNWDNYQEPVETPAVQPPKRRCEGIETPAVQPPKRRCPPRMVSTER